MYQRMSLLLILTILFSFHSHAADPQKKRAARKRFQHGLVLLQERAYEEAIEEFKLSFEYHPNKNALYNLATTYYTMARYLDALNAFAQLEKQYSEELDKELEATIAKFKRELSVLISALTITVNPSGSALSIDGKPFSQEPSETLLLDQGVYEIEASFQGYETARISVQLSLGEKKAIHMELKQLPSKSDESQTETEPVPDDSEHSELKKAAPASTTTLPVDYRDDRASKDTPLKVLFWSGAAVTGITGALSIGFLVAAKRSYDSFKDSEQRLMEEDYESMSRRDELYSSYKAAKSDAEKYSRLGLAFGITGGVFAAATTVVFVLQNIRHRKETPEAAIVPNGLVVTF